MKNVQIYTDGACKGNPGPGGWGAIIVYGSVERELSGGEERTTNNRMELSGAIAGLAALKERCPVTLYSDSKYLIDALQKGWAVGWRARREEVGRQACTESRSVGAPARADGAA